MIELLTIDELSHHIKRSKGAIRNLVLRRKIPYRKPAGRLLFPADEIEKWIKASEGVSLDELLDK